MFTYFKKYYPNAELRVSALCEFENRFIWLQNPAGPRYATTYLVQLVVVVLDVLTI